MLAVEKKQGIIREETEEEGCQTREGGSKKKTNGR